MCAQQIQAGGGHGRTRWAAACIALALLAVMPAMAQPQAAPEDLNKVFRTLEAPGATEPPVLLTDNGGFIHFLGAPPSGRFTARQPADKSAGPVGVARNFVNDYSGAFGILSPKTDFCERTVRREANTFVQMAQTYNGLSVLGAEMVVQVNDDGSVRNIMNSLAKNTAPLDSGKTALSPAIAAGLAPAMAIRLEAAMQGRAENEFTASDAELMIFAPEVFGRSGEPQLVWRVEVRPVDVRQPEVAVFVNAHSGIFAFHYPLRPDAKSRNIYDANYQEDLSLATLMRKEGDAPLDDDVIVNNIYDYLGVTYDWYNSNFGRDSWDAAGAVMTGYAHYPFLNASWVPSLSAMLFGDLFIADDITGHEMTHAVTGTDVDLIYEGFSGALNEALSDWGGEFIDLTDGLGNDSAAVRWYLGEDSSFANPDVPANSGIPPSAIRYMKDPTVFGDPDRMTSPYLRSPYSLVDYGGVHSNSGVINKLTYLLTDGDTFNGQTVAGMGIPTVAQVYYNAIPLMTSSSNFFDFYAALGASSIGLGLTFDQRINIAAGGRAVEIEPPELALLGLRNFRAVPVKDKDSNPGIALTWDNPPAGAASQLLLIRSVGRFAMHPGDGTSLAVATNATKYLDMNVSPGVEYFYTLIADLSAGFPEVCYARAVAGVQAPNILTQAFGTDELLGALGPIDLAFSQITFSPVGAPMGPIAGDSLGASYENYEGTIQKNVYSLPVPRNDAKGGAMTLTFTDNGSIRIPLNSYSFPFFGKRYGELYLAANGYISFQNLILLPDVTVGDSSTISLNFPSLASHFAVPRISFLFNDFAPNMGGEAWARYLSDRMVFTFVNMPSWPNSLPTNNVGRSTVQVELFYNGTIRFTYQGLGVTNADVGISDGLGAPREPSLEFPNLQRAFTMSDLSALPVLPQKLTLVPVAPVVADAGDLITLDVISNHPQGLTGVPIYTATWDHSGAPPFADLQNGTGRLYWQTTPQDKGVWNLRVLARQGAQTAYQDIRIFIGRTIEKPTAINLAISTDTPFEDPAQSRAVPVKRTLTASYEYFHPLAAEDPAYYGEGATSVFWFRNGQVVTELVDRDVVPAEVPRAGDRWWFGVVPVTASYIVGDMVLSPVVTIVGFPVLTSVTPAFGLTVGGDQVSIHGERFSGATAVTFGGVKGVNLRVMSDTEVQITTPLHPSGLVDVVVESVDGVGRITSGFRFVGDGSELFKEDVNKDGRVDAVDVQLVTAAVLRTATAAKAAVDADVNGDGKVNASDIQSVVNKALHR